MRTAHIVLHTLAHAVILAAFVAACFVWLGVLTGRL